MLQQPSSITLSKQYTKKASKSIRYLYKNKINKKNMLRKKIRRLTRLCNRRS